MHDALMSDVVVLDDTANASVQKMDDNLERTITDIPSPSRSRSPQQPQSSQTSIDLMQDFMVNVIQFRQGVDGVFEVNPVIEQVPHLSSERNQTEVVTQGDQLQTELRELDNKTNTWNPQKFQIPISLTLIRLLSGLTLYMLKCYVICFVSY